MLGTADSADTLHQHKSHLHGLSPAWSVTCMVCPLMPSVHSLHFGEDMSRTRAKSSCCCFCFWILLVLMLTLLTVLVLTFTCWQYWCWCWPCWHCWCWQCDNFGADHVKKCSCWRLPCQHLLWWHWRQQKWLDFLPMLMWCDVRDALSWLGHTRHVPPWKNCQIKPGAYIWQIKSTVLVLFSLQSAYASCGINSCWWNIGCDFVFVVSRRKMVCQNRLVWCSKWWKSAKASLFRTITIRSQHIADLLSCFYHPDKSCWLVWLYSCQIHAR